jgi:peptidoglycan/xylan/chitin deacetylase (PgdA/CDA1 family)
MTSLRSYIGAAHRKLLTSVYRRSWLLGDQRPVVSFSFDDFPRSAYTVGGSILRRCGGLGTYYVTPGLMSKTNELGKQFELNDLRALIEDGHELASHTRSHLSSRQVAFEEFQDDTQKGREAIAEIVGEKDSGNFAYPFGCVTVEAKRKLGPQMVSCRGTIGGINGPEIDLNLLRANRLYGGINRLEQVRKLIQTNEREKGWLIFYTHDVSESPSAYGCTPMLLEASVSYAAQRARIMTVAAVLAMSGIGA